MVCKAAHVFHLSLPLIECRAKHLPMLWRLVSHKRRRRPIGKILKEWREIPEGDRRVY